MKDRLHLLQGKRVEIKAHGILYHGVFVGTDEDYLYLKAETTWITLGLDAITAVRREGGDEREWLRKEIEGEPVPPPDRRELKRRYNLADLEKLHLMNLATDWPEENEISPPAGRPRKTVHDFLREREQDTASVPKNTR